MNLELNSNLNKKKNNGRVLMEKISLYLLIILGIIGSITITGGLIFILLPSPEPLPDLGKAPNFDLVDQGNQSVTLDSYAGTVRFIGFIYTDCQDAGFCPLTTSKMVSLHNKLLENGYTEEDFHLITISFDWRYDNPEKMHIYATNYGITDFSTWSFLSGSQTQVEDTLSSYNVYTFETDDPNDLFLIHNLRHDIIDNDGHLRADYGDNSWEVDDAYNIITRLINE